MLRPLALRLSPLLLPLPLPLPLLLLLLLPLAGCSTDAPTMEVRRVQRDLLAGEPSWTVVSNSAGQPPVVRVLTPSIDNASDAADRLSLVMHPPSEVTFEVRQQDGPVQLMTTAGVDLAVARRMHRLLGSAGRVTVRFEVLVDGDPVFAEDLTTYARLPAEDATPQGPPNVWQPVGGVTGLSLEPGNVVTLRTTLMGQAPDGLGPIPAGFGGLVLERIEQRERAAADADHPNLLLVVMDTQRADRTSAHGYERATTPWALALAERGTRFDAAYSSSSWTWPSTASLLTGRSPEAHGVVDFRSCWLADEVETLAEALQDAGYSTAGFSGNPLVSRERNFDQGFEVFETSPEVVKSDWVVPRALKWLEQHKDRRFFLYLQLHDAHVPHTPRRQDLERLAGVSEPRFDPMRMQAQTYVLKSAAAHTADDRPRPELLMQPGEARWYSEVYDACVATGDHWLGVVLQYLDDAGLSENTLIVYTSDHGEELLDHGLLSHNHELWQELVHVPLIVAGPGIPAGRRVATPVANRHLAPTLAKHLGVQLDAPRDALDLFADETPEGPVFFDTSHGWWKGRQFVPLLGVREGDWVLHWSPEGKDWDAPPNTDPQGGQVRLFNLSTDPGEQRNVAGAHPKRVDRMRELLLRHRSRAAQDRPARKRRAGAATMEILRDAGYAGSDDE